ncbi:RNA polymerase II elongation factor ELL2-like isoform X2 [Talpa occidentalis]|uniref:RNA polymerase II elongation factor ELL2-like isoform X2 n=1 Tax=Talpa occidentalis TaxID=50954 RepID=UPI00188E789B|nr:RNA polymerase II elongation factor ELL2-like isoform X2 [Talpa occidentalis]
MDRYDPTAAFEAVGGMMYQDGELPLEELYWAEPRLGSTESELSMQLTGAALQPPDYYQYQENIVSPHTSLQFQGFPGLTDPPLDNSPSSMFNINFQWPGMSGEYYPGHSQQSISSDSTSQDSSLHFMLDNTIACQPSSSYPMAQAGKAQGREESGNTEKMIQKPRAGIRVPIRKAAQTTPDPVPERKRTAPINPAYTIRKSRVANTVHQRSYRDRVIHLLALKNYKKHELLIRLQKDGIPSHDKNSLATILYQVADFNPNDSSYSLKDDVFKELQRDWPGYSELDRQSLEMVLSRKGTGTDAPSSLFGCSIDNTVSLSQAQLYESPSRRKKIRISHLATTDQSMWRGTLNKSSERPALSLSPPSVATTSPSPPQPAAAPPTAHSPRPAVPPHRGCPRTTEGPRIQDSCGETISHKRRIFKPQRCNCSDMEPAVPLAHPTKHSKVRGRRGAISEKKRKGKFAEDQGKGRKHNPERVQKRKTHPVKESQGAKSSSHEEVKGVSLGSERPALSEDYLADYVLVVNSVQRRRYEQDFKVDFDEYQALYAKMLTLSEVFIKLDSERKQLSPDSKEFQDINKKITLEYEKMKKANPNYNAEKHRCKYLYNKLVHIKKLVTDYDQQQAQCDTRTGVRPE